MDHTLHSPLPFLSLPFPSHTSLSIPFLSLPCPILILSREWVEKGREKTCQRWPKGKGSEWAVFLFSHSLRHINRSHTILFSLPFLITHSLSLPLVTISSLWPPTWQRRLTAPHSPISHDQKGMEWEVVALTLSLCRVFSRPFLTLLSISMPSRAKWGLGKRWEEWGRWVWWWVLILPYDSPIDTHPSIPFSWVSHIPLSPITSRREGRDPIRERDREVTEET